MHFFTKTMLSLAAIASFAVGAYAVPAKPGLHRYQNPDGSSVEIRVSGDEHACYYTSSDGYVLMPSDNGSMCYAVVKNNKLVNSHMLAKDAGVRTAGELRLLEGLDAPAMRRMAESAATTRRMARAKAKTFSPDGLVGNYPTTGSPNVLVLLIDFQDVKFKAENDPQAFKDLLTKKGYDFNGATGCAREYFEAQSHGVFSPNVVVVGPVTLPQGLAYYGAPGGDGNPDGRGYQLVIDACDVISKQDPGFDFARFDNDNDGFIDNIFMFYAGRGQHDGGPSYTIWPHAWNIYRDLGLNYEFGGKKLGSYACANELQGALEQRNGIGVFCHEYSHVLGLVDNYPTHNASHNNHPGQYDLMSEGPYLNNSNTPCNMSAFERYSIGWLNPRQLSGAEDVALQPLDSSNQGLIVKTISDDEFFILENRQNIGWDTYLPGHGMLVWHIDYDEEAWTENMPNNDANHQRIDIMEADGMPGDQSYAGDTYPGSNRVTSITKWPTWTNTTIDMPLTNIHEDGGVVYFRVKGGGTVIDPVTSLPATDVTATGFTANWTTRGGLSYEIDLCKGLSPVPMTTVTVTGAGSHAFTGLEPSTDYSYVVRAVDADLKSVDSERQNVRTDDPYFDMIAAESLPASNISKTGFTARWSQLKDAVAYLVDVYQKDAVAPKHISVNFDNAAIPSDWYSNSTDYDARRFGAAAPSLSMPFNGAQVASPVFDDDINALSFWYRAYRPAENGFISIDVKTATDATWQTLYTVQPLTTATAGTTVKVGDGGMLMPTGIKSIRIVNHAPDGGTSQVYVDDIALDYAGTYTPVYVKDFENANVGNVTEVAVSGLNDNTSYYYTVRGLDAEGKMSLLSAEQNVVTGSQSGIDDIAGASFSVSASHGVIAVAGAEGGVKVYAVDGLLVASSTAADATFEGLAKGVYIVSCGAQTVKVAL